MNSKSKVQETPLISLNTTALLKIVFCFFVLMHHMLPTQTQIGNFITSTLGPIAVGGFFLLSGYGVTISLKTKGETYLKKLISVKAVKFYLYVVLINALASILFIVFGGHFDSVLSYFSSIMHLPFFDCYVPMCSWLYFLVQLAIYYILFAVIAKSYKNHNQRILLIAITFIGIALAVVGILTCINATSGSGRVLRACFCFPIGILLANYSTQINKFFQKIRSSKLNRITILLYVLVFYFVSLFFTKNVIMYEYITPIIITLYIVFVVSGKNFKCQGINYIASLTLDVYLFHQVYFKLFRDYLHLTNSYLIFFAVIMYSLITALFIKWVKFLIKKYKPKNKSKQA